MVIKLSTEKSKRKKAESLKAREEKKTKAGESLLRELDYVIKASTANPRVAWLVTFHIAQVLMYIGRLIDAD